MGTKNQGQGHPTIFRQILIDKLGLKPEEIRFTDGDTDTVAFGIGTNGSRSTVIGGTAITIAAGKVITKAKRLAAHLLEVSEADLSFADGRFQVVPGTDQRSLTVLREVARAAPTNVRAPAQGDGRTPGLLRDRHVRADPGHLSQRLLPVCEVEIDPEHGPRRDRRPMPWSTMSAPSSIPSTNTQGADPRRRRAGRRAGADGAGGL